MGRRFAAEGARVLVADLNEEAARAVAGSIGTAAVACRVDVADSASYQAMVDRALEAFGDLDTVVNNAGYTYRNQPLLEHRRGHVRPRLRRQREVDLPLRAELRPVFRRRGGGVVLNIGSTAGLRPRPGLTWYNGSKAAVNLISKSLAVELAPDRIRVNAICPVMGATGMLKSFMGVPDTPENRARFVATIPLGRLSQPEDVASAAVYLVSDEAAFLRACACRWMEEDGVAAIIGVMNGDRDPVLTPETLGDALNELGQLAHEAGRVIDVAVYGGSCLMLVSNFRIRHR